MRKAQIKRDTLETKIEIEINLDGDRNINIETGIPFFDHMLTLFAFHGALDLKILANGDLAVDSHHTMEDVGIALGQVIYQALGQRIGINRYGLSYVPMDEALSRVVIDMSNRPYLVFNASFKRETIGTMDTENVLEFFKSFVNESRMNLHIENFYGDNDHHKVESIFKAFGRAIKEALRITSPTITSTKGVL
jgi:imidazoleglycerol-phosphate dehydratase